MTIPRERGHATFILWEPRSFPQSSHDTHIIHALGSSFSGLNSHVPPSKAQIFWLLEATSIHQIPTGRERGLPLSWGPETFARAEERGDMAGDRRVGSAELHTYLTGLASTVFGHQPLIGHLLCVGRHWGAAGVLPSLCLQGAR